MELKLAYRTLTKDPVLKKVISKTGKFTLSGKNEIYISLLHSIASQQLSSNAGDTIFGRFLDLFPARNPVPEKVLKCKPEVLRGCGLSVAKASYMQNIARFKMDGGLDLRKLKRLEDQELINHLTQVKGVGRWTAEMILMFTLNRPDVLPLDDVGIQNAIKILYNLEGRGKEIHHQMIEVAESWRPHRTLACRHLWRYSDVLKSGK
ncbi:MAG TPA: DNA-3-methyladenine glycosylase [Bacteroidia bacterium]|nr:DNA-3-methyladenine glycosylase [Bacteroidia bacterium]